MLADGTTRNNIFNEDGTLYCYYLYYPSVDGLRYYSECFYPDGTSEFRSVRVNDANGKWLYSSDLDENGHEAGRRSVAVYDGDECIGWDNYNDGVLCRHARFDENGRTVFTEVD